MSDTHAQQIRDLYGEFARGDIQSVVARFDPKIEWTEAAGFPYGGQYTGPEEVVNGVLVRLGTEWDSFAAVPNEFVDGGDTIVVLGTYSGKYKATGKSIDVDFAHVWTMRAGKAVRFVQYVDTAIVQAAVTE